LILIAAPVRGLRPVRAALAPTLKVPNPTKVTLSFFLSAPFIAANAPSNALPAEALEILADFAIA